MTNVPTTQRVFDGTDAIESVDSNTQHRENMHSESKVLIQPRGANQMQVATILAPLVPQNSKANRLLSEKIASLELTVDEAKRIRDICGNSIGRLGKVVRELALNDDFDRVATKYAVADFLKDDRYSIDLVGMSSELFMKLQDVFHDLTIHDPNNADDVEKTLSLLIDLHYESGYSGGIGSFARKMLQVQEAFPDEILSLADAVVLYQKIKSFFKADPRKYGYGVDDDDIDD